MGNVTTYGDISPRTAANVKVKILSRGQLALVTERFGQVDPLQKNKTKSCVWRRYLSLARVTAPLAEGITPTAQKLTYEDITCTLEQWGGLVETTDVVIDTHEDNILDQAESAIAEQISESLEIMRFAFMKAGSNVFYASGVASRALVNAPPTRADLHRIYRFFASHRAKRISRIIAPTPNYATEAVAPAYIALGSTDLDADIQKISGFIPVEQYASDGKSYEYEIGKVGQFRFILTPLNEPWLQAGLAGTTYLSGGVAVSVAAQCDVYPLLFLAQDAYGIVPLQGENAVTPMVINPKPTIGVDPLAQKGAVSWKTYQNGAILNQSWIARLECAASANPS